MLRRPIRFTTSPPRRRPWGYPLQSLQQSGSMQITTEPGRTAGSTTRPGSATSSSTPTPRGGPTTCSSAGTGTGPMWAERAGTTSFPPGAWPPALRPISRPTSITDASTGPLITMPTGSTESRPTGRAAGMSTSTPRSGWGVPPWTAPRR